MASLMREIIFLIYDRFSEVRAFDSPDPLVITTLYSAFLGMRLDSRLKDSPIKNNKTPVKATPQFPISAPTRTAAQPEIPSIKENIDRPILKPFLGDLIVILTEVTFRSA